MRFDTSNFLFPVIFNIALLKWYSCIKSLYWSYVYFFELATFDYVDYVFWVAAWVFFYFEFSFRVFKGNGFSFYNYTSHILHRLFLHLVTLCAVFSPNVEEVTNFKDFWVVFGF